MKKIVRNFVFLGLLASGATAFAQTSSGIADYDSRNELRFGLKAGVNFSNVYDEEGQDFVADGKAGIAAGAFLSVPLGKFIGFQPEIMYSQKGYKQDFQVLNFGNQEIKVTTTYLDIPLQLQIKPIEQLTFLVGPQYSYLLDTKYEFNDNSTTNEEDVNSDNLKKNVFGFVVGADVNLENFVISGRAGWDISKSNEDGESTDPRFKNQVIQVTLGYRF
jgi:hypothetical protein